LPLTAQPVNACRISLRYRNNDGFLAGNRFFLAYAGSPPSGANCNTLATDVANHWNSDIAPAITSDWTLYEVDVVDLSSDVAASGTAAVSHPGTVSGATLPSNVAANVEYDIARRYRGGKPRIYLPGGSPSNLANDSTWSTGWLSTLHTVMTDFKADCEGDSIGSMGALTYVNISFVQGYDTNQPPTGKWRGPGHKYPPLYRSTPLVDHVTDFSPKAVIGSQRRRRTSTTP
jgi:hypothetical protein